MDASSIAGAYSAVALCYAVNAARTHISSDHCLDENKRSLTTNDCNLVKLKSRKQGI